MNEEALRTTIRQLVVERDGLLTKRRAAREKRGGRPGIEQVTGNKAKSSLSSSRTVILRGDSGYKVQRGERSLETNTAEQRMSSTNKRKLSKASADHRSEQQDEDENIVKRPKRNEDGATAKRTKALFGNLLGHLKKAKAHLEKEKETKQAEFHKAQENKVEQKLEEYHKVLEQKRQAAIEEKKLKDAARLEAIQKQLCAKESELLRMQVEKHYRLMSNFIRTRSQPTLFWLPAQHNDKTLRLQLENKAAIQTKIDSLEEKFCLETETGTAVEDSDRNSHKNEQDEGESQCGTTKELAE